MNKTEIETRMRQILIVMLHYHPCWQDDAGREIKKGLKNWGSKIPQSAMLTDAFAYWYNESRFNVDFYDSVFSSIFYVE